MELNIINKGNYATIIQPPIFINKEDNNILLNDVGKVFNKKEEEQYNKEIEILKQIKNIKNYKDFTVEIKDFSKIIHNEYSYQIIFEYGGITINKLQHNIKFNQFIILFKKLVYGIQKLHNNNIIHRDIKPPNVLINNNKLNLIDFGLACNVNDVYNNYDDNNYLLSYMYMYNPPEFYVAYLLDSRKNIDENFIITFEKVFYELTTYSHELKVYYNEHYYMYNTKEPYNIYSYKDGFSRFYKDIIDKKFTTYSEIFTNEIAYKSDVYSLSFILKCFKKYIEFENINQKQYYNEIFDMTYDLNPFTRCSIKELIKKLEEISN